MMGCGSSKSRPLKDKRPYKVRNEQETTTTDLVAQIDDVVVEGTYKTYDRVNSADIKNSNTKLQIDIADSDKSVVGLSKNKVKSKQS